MAQRPSSVVRPFVCQLFHENIFSRTNEPILTKLDRKLPYDLGIQICSNQRSGLFGDPQGAKNEKKIDKYFKMFFSRTTGPNTLIFCMAHHWDIGNFVQMNSLE